MKTVIITLFILVLSACTNAQVYEAPENIIYNNDLITWDAIQDAVSYKVILDDEETLLEESSFDVSHLLDGSYTISIYAIYIDNTEVFSSFNFTVNRFTPVNLSITNNILSFDSSELSTYELFIDEVLITTFNTPSIDLSDYIELFNNYNIQVVAIYDGISYPSEPIQLNTFTKLDLDQEITFELRSSNEISFDFESLDQILWIEMNETIIDETLYTSTSTSLTFNEELFFYPSYGTSLILRFFSQVSKRSRH